MTKKEILEGLARKVDASKAECVRIMERLIELPGHTITEETHARRCTDPTCDFDTCIPATSTDLLNRASAQWKEMMGLQQLGQLAMELVPDDGSVPGLAGKPLQAVPPS